MKYIVNKLMFPVSRGIDPSALSSRQLSEYVERAARAPRGSITSAELYRRSVDARKKDSVSLCCSALVETGLSSESFTRLFGRLSPEAYTYRPYRLEAVSSPPKTRPVVAGFGPAGMLAALFLARAGLAPIVLERGASVDERLRAVKALELDGVLDPETNIQFGEGGAGTFSDGKLNTGIKDPRCRAVLETLAEFGAGRAILTDAKPHVGTDRLTETVKNIRKEIIALGGEVRFGTRLTSYAARGGVLTSVTAESSEGAVELPCSELILATGHSARDTFEMLHASGLEMTSKPFSVGARIEHPQAFINRAQYGEHASSPMLGAADYKLFCHLPNGRGVYTFCMCPGGYVVNASSELGCVVTNGMSYSDRGGVNANSALLVGVDSNDFGEGALSGMYFQREIEQRAFELAGGYRCIAQRVGELFGLAPDGAAVEPTVRPEPFFGELSAVLPYFVIEAMGEGLRVFDRKLRGFMSAGALLTGPETRSSSPVRILRGTGLQSSVEGIYPCGEGAGYAGGIVSAAVDGIRVAEAIAEKYR